MKYPKIQIFMLRKKFGSESVESGIEIADSGFLIIYKKLADSGSRIRIRIAIPDSNKGFLIPYKIGG